MVEFFATDEIDEALSRDSLSNKMFGGIARASILRPLSVVVPPTPEFTETRPQTGGHLSRNLRPSVTTCYLKS